MYKLPKNGKAFDITALAKIFLDKKGEKDEKNHEDIFVRFDGVLPF